MEVPRGYEEYKKLRLKQMEKNEDTLKESRKKGLFYVV